MPEQTPARDPIHHALNRVHALAARPARDAARCFWIEGVRNFVHAADAGLRFETILYSPILLQSDLADMLTRRLRAAGVPRLRLTPEQFRTISRAERASGIGAIVRQHWVSPERIAPTADACVLVAEEVRSPGNLGTILRTAEACGVAGVLFVGPRCDPFDPAVVRASMAGLFHLRIARVTHNQLACWARASVVELVGLSPHADHLWTALPAGRPLALVLGEERHGLSPRLRQLCTRSVRLPMTGRADSLNVSVAAAIVLYELVRRATVSTG